MKHSLFVLAAVMSCGLVGTGWGQNITRASVDSAGLEGTGASNVPEVSADGSLVVFESDAPNLVVGDIGGNRDVFLHNRTTGVTVRVSEKSGVGGDADSGRPAISADGSTVVFESLAKNLVPGDFNSVHDIFSYNVATGLILRVSVDNNGVEGNGQSREPAVSDNGKFVAFHSEASNLHILDHNLFRDVFVRDMGASVNHLASLGAGGTSGNNHSGYVAAVALSGNGQQVAFISNASDLVLGDTNGVADMFVTNLATSLVQRVTVTTAGVEANGTCRACDISGDGKLVVFDSVASNLVIGDMNGAPDVFLRNMAAGTTERMSVDSNGIEANAYSVFPMISGDGTTVVFNSLATNLVAMDLNGFSDVFTRNVASGQVRRVSEDPGGLGGNGASSDACLNLDGTVTVFASSAKNLVLGDMNGVGDVFVASPGGTSDNSGASDCDCTAANGPCSTVSGPDRGCPNSNINALGAQLIGSGNAAIGADTFSMTVTDAAPIKPGLILSGDATLGPNGFGTIPDSAGLLCVGGSTRRGSVVLTDANGAASFPDFQGAAYGDSDIVGVGVSISYTYWFRDPGTANGCVGDTGSSDFNFSNGWTVTWL
jgi:Tol biopolymer transport system component